MTRREASRPEPAELPLPVARILADPVTERHVSRMWQNIAARRYAGAGHVSVAMRWAIAGVLLGTLVTLLAVSLLRGNAPVAVEPPREPGPLRLASGGSIDVVEVATPSGPFAVRLSDGSSIQVQPGARLEPLASSGSQFVSRLVRGRAVFHVTPGGPRRWLVEAGIATIEVVGTEFSVERSLEDVRVEVSHGVVLVRGDTLPDGVVRLVAGESVTVAAGKSKALRTESAEPPPARERPARAATAPWRAALAGGGYRDAYAALGAAGLAGEVARSESADELFDLADVARLSGHPAEAVLPLERLLNLHGGGPRAPIAALTLGRIELELGKPRSAAKHLERALGLGVPRALEEDAHVRLVQAYAESGQSTEARRVADEYARRYPDGRRGAEVQAWLRR